ncbi:MAG: AMP-binding protein [Acidobacteria bacterium]|nr:AMP-binding protein [Acidobacteriota bacterium]
MRRYLENADRLAGKTALQLSTEEGLQSFTYADVFQTAWEIARLIRSHFPEVDAVAILMNYDPHWAIVFFGVCLSGSCAVPLDTQLSAAEVANLVRHSGARVVFADVANQEKLLNLDVIVVDPHVEGLFRRCSRPSEAGKSGAEKLEAAEDRSGSVERLSMPHASNSEGASSPMVIIYTSGTTGDPKGVMLSEANFYAELTGLLEFVPVGENDHLLSVLPLHHVLALLTGLLAPLYAGAMVTFLSTVERARVLRVLQTLGITGFVCVPQFFYLLHSHVWSEISRRPSYARAVIRWLMRINFLLRRQGMNLGKWFFPQIHRAFGERFRFFAAGGSYFDPVVVRDLAAWGLNIVQAYGLTETCGACTATSLRNQYWGSVGRPLPGVEIRIVRPNAEGRGEIAIRGPVVTSGYFRNDEATRHAFQDGWFLSGDLGFCDGYGFYYITGRVKEVIVLASGKNVYPEELERHYSKHPAVKEIAIVPKIGPSGEEQLHAIVVPDFEYLRSQKIANSMEVIRFEIESLASQLAPYKRIAGLQLRTEPLPRTTTRKLKRRELQAQLEQFERKAVVPARFQNRVAEETYRFLCRLGKTPEIFASNANLELDFGLDSLQRIELFSHLEEVFGASLPQEQAAELYTLQDLVNLFDPETSVLREVQRQGQSWSRLLAQDEPFAEPFLRFRPVSHKVVDALRLFFRYFLGKSLFKLQVEGIENLRETGPYLICPNHLSYLDGLFFVSVFPRAVFDRVFFLGYSEYFQMGFKRRFAEWIHIIPLDPDTYLVRALRAGAMGLRQQRILCVFPEGARSIDGQVKPFKHGASILAREINVPIIPAAIAGTYEVWPRHRPGIRVHPVRISFGKPMDPAAYSSYVELTQALQTMVQELFSRARSALGKPVSE